MRILLPLAIVVLMSCGSQPASPTSGVPYRLYTHCGVLYADFEGKRYYADPPISDGNGNPGPGWNNPFDDGTLTVADANTVVFTDPRGNRARFRTHPKSGIPTIYPCD